MGAKEAASQTAAEEKAVQKAEEKVESNKKTVETQKKELTQEKKKAATAEKKNKTLEKEAVAAKMQVASAKGLERREIARCSEIGESSAHSKESTIFRRHCFKQGGARQGGQA